MIDCLIKLLPNINDTNNSTRSKPQTTHGARNVYMGMIQTETPYFQPAANTPFLDKASSVLAAHSTDPTFCTGDSRCNMAYAVSVQV
jgi:hypothetical protein